MLNGLFLCVPSSHCKHAYTFTGEKVCARVDGQFFGPNRWQRGKLITSLESQLVQKELYK